MSEKWSGEEKVALVFAIIIKLVTWAVTVFVVLAILQAIFHFV